MAGRPPAHLTRHAVLLHGFTGAGASWASLAGSLEDVGIGVLAPDLPGHGRAPLEAAGDGFNPDVSPDVSLDVTLTSALDVIDRAVETATRRASGRRPLLLGYSMGGRLALHYAHRSPEALHGLVLESASPGLEHAEEREARVASDRALARRVRDIGIERFSEEWGAKPIFRSQESVAEDVRAAVAAQRLRSDPEGLARALEGLGTGALPSLWDSLGEIRVRTLLISGALDLKFTTIAEAMSERMPNASVLPVPNVGHRVHLEAPDVWLRAVADFADQDRGHVLFGESS